MGSHSGSSGSGPGGIRSASAATYSVARKRARLRSIRLEGKPDPITAGTPFLPELGPSKDLGDSTLAALAGVRSRVIVAFRTSTPTWEIERHYRKVAKAIGVDPQKLRGKIARGKAELFGRRSTLPSLSTSLFKNLRP